MSVKLQYAKAVSASVFLVVLAFATFNLLTSSAPYGVGPHVVAPNGGPPSNAYLTNATAPFLVERYALPEVKFDIGESYAGLLPLDDTGKELFFWFVPSQNPAAGDEVTIWLNGGPGCSSLFGFLHEQGPVNWRPGTFAPVHNPWGWNRLTNVIWVDQPVGTGFSRGTPNATSSVEVAAQFLGFWINFVDLFGLHDKQLYITGESFAGQYVPYIADAMLDRADTEYFNVSGIMLYDPSFGWPQITKQVPAVAFIESNRNVFPMNETFLAHVREMNALCGYEDFMAAGLQFPPNGPLPPPPAVNANGNVTEGCYFYDDIYRAAVALNPCFDIYNVAQMCPIPWDILDPPASSHDESPSGSQMPASAAYFQRADVKTAIHAPVDIEWMLCTDRPVIANWTDMALPSALTGGPLQRIVEATGNVIVAHGTLDMILILNGTLLTLQNLTWNGAQGFSRPPLQPFHVPSRQLSTKDSALAEEGAGSSIGSQGRMGRWISERGLTFCSVELSGHEIPAYQPAAAFRQLELLLGRVANLSEVAPFSA